MVIGRSGGRGSRRGPAAVVSTWRRSGVTGRSTPAQAPTSRDQAPAAQTTVEVRTVPRSVTTALTSPPSLRIPVTADPVTRRAPSRRAAVAYPSTTDSGVQYPSVGENAAAIRPSVLINGESRCASAGSTRRLGTPRAF